MITLNIFIVILTILHLIIIPLIIIFYFSSEYHSYNDLPKWNYRADPKTVSNNIMSPGEISRAFHMDYYSETELIQKYIEEL